MGDIPQSWSRSRSLQDTLQHQPPTRTMPSTPIPSSSLAHLLERIQQRPGDIRYPYLSMTTTALATQSSQGQVNVIPGRDIPENPYTTTASGTAAAIVTDRERTMVLDEARQQELALRVDAYDAELAFLHDQWVCICITLSSLRHSYIAVVVDRGNSIDPTVSSSNADFPIPDNVAVSTFRVKPNARARGFTTVHPPSRRWSAIAPNSLEPDIDHEMLLALDEILVQIRQMETNMERLERDIQNTLRLALRYFTDE